MFFLGSCLTTIARSTTSKRHLRSRRNIKTENTKTVSERIQSRQRQARTKPSKPHMICRTPNLLRCWASSFSCRMVRSCNHRPEIPKKQTRVSGGINIVHWCSLVGHQPGHHVWYQLIRRTLVHEFATVTFFTSTVATSLHVNCSDFTCLN